MPIVAIDKGHLGRARGVASVLDLKVNAYVADPLKPGELVGKLESLVATPRRTRPRSRACGRCCRARRWSAADLKGFPLPALLVRSTGCAAMACWWWRTGI